MVYSSVSVSIETRIFSEICNATSANKNCPQLPRLLSKTRRKWHLLRAARSLELHGFPGARRVYVVSGVETKWKRISGAVSLDLWAQCVRPLRRDGVRSQEHLLLSIQSTSSVLDVQEARLNHYRFPLFIVECSVWATMA